MCADKRKRKTPSSVSNFVAYSQASAEITNKSERNGLRAHFYDAIDATNQATKDRFDPGRSKTSNKPKQVLDWPNKQRSPRGCQG